MADFKAPKAKRKEAPQASSSLDALIEPPTKKQRLDKQQQQQDEAPALSLVQLQNMLISLEKHVNKNLQERMKFANDPQKFMESELEVDGAVKNLLVLATTPELYVEFVQLRGVDLIISLLSHENTDIVMGCINLISDLTESDTFVENEQAKILIQRMLEQQVIELVVSVMINKLDENNEDEATSVHHCMEILENLAEIDASICEEAVQRTELVQWLCYRINKTEATEEMHPNKLYASELLSIFLQTSALVRARFANEDIMDALLSSLSYYRTKKPSGMDEKECIQNLFNCMCSALMEPDNQATFLKCEGIELMLLLIKEKKFARFTGIKTLDYALMNNFANCKQFIDVMGFKTFFALFMSDTESMEDVQAFEEHLISILMSIFKYVAKDAENSSRLIKKFTENHFEKLDRLIDITVKYYGKVSLFDERLQNGELQDIVGDDADAIFVERLSAGLLILQQCCMLCAYLCQHADLKSAILMFWKQNGISVDEIVIFIKEYLLNLSKDKKQESELIQQVLLHVEEQKKQQPTTTSSAIDDAPLVEDE